MKQQCPINEPILATHHSQVLNATNQGPNKYLKLLSWSLCNCCRHTTHFVNSTLFVIKQKIEREAERRSSMFMKWLLRPWKPHRFLSGTYFKGAFKCLAFFTVKQNYFSLKKTSCNSLSSSQVENRKSIQETKNRPCIDCLLYTSPSPRDRQKSRMPSSA